MPARRPLPSDRLPSVRATVLQKPAAARRRVSTTMPLDWDCVDHELSLIDGILQGVEPPAIVGAEEPVFGPDPDRIATGDLDLRLPATFLTE